MIQGMIQNMLGDYAKYIQILPNGNIKLSVPVDFNDLSKGTNGEIELSIAEVTKLFSIIQQPKEYESDGKHFKEGDSDFDMNKWSQLVLNEIKK